MNDGPIEFGSFRAEQRFQAVGRRVHPLQRDLSMEETMQGEVKTVQPLFGPDIRTSVISSTLPAASRTSLATCPPTFSLIGEPFTMW